MGAKKQTIVKILRKKINNWIETIPDEELQKLIKRDVLVSGGSIVSLLLGEEVNDYDLYFKTTETAERLLSFYLYVADASDVKVLVEGSRVKPLIGDRGQIVCDGKENYAVRCITDNAITLNNDIQLIIRFTGSSHEIHKNFDFVHATCVYDFCDNKLNLPEAALTSILAKDLVFINSVYPVAALLRIRKFINRGWRISAGQMVKIILKTNKLDLYDLETLKDQLIGVDSLYMSEFIKEVADRGEVNYTVLAEILDSVFDYE